MAKSDKSKPREDDVNTGNDPFENMMAMWKQGQAFFLNAQKEAAENFGASFSASKDSGTDGQSASLSDQWQKIIEPWMFPNADILGWQKFEENSSAFYRFIDPANWPQNMPEEMRKLLENIGQGPRFADMATPHIDAANSWREFLDYQNATADYSKIIQEAWARAYTTFSKEFSLEDLQAGDSQEAIQAWLKIANDELLDTQRSQEFMDAQKKLLLAGTEIKARQKEMAEKWCESFQIPTRSEMDDMAQIVQELRVEVRTLKRQLKAFKNKGD